ncbi:hypothetical protein Emtol_2984 [Emticicia oligotrophica DSM 17448]|uniref:Uncharacterized protein n=1 Tax=Emticicia oligotrophica (strain DSM 17448 / CIP 109782 / MTCC 6937 / GPTSA100-15) TaxID=929562 RepID=A0ABM5N3T7_EMTOG|nr:hypothetical protein [Emticicia oligotrophica]AFK04117.1 hypothetical protein Emtol_2984 [Emticicia oligotrophica DSM 17448]
MSFLSSLFGKNSTSKPRTSQEYQEMLILEIEKLESSKLAGVELIYLLSSDESVQTFRKKASVNFKKEDVNTMVIASKADFEYDIRLSTNFNKRSIALFDLAPKTFEEIQKKGVNFLKQEGYKCKETKEINNFLGQGTEMKFHHSTDVQKSITVTFIVSQKPFISIFHTEMVFHV